MLDSRVVQIQAYVNIEAVHESSGESPEIYELKSWRPFDLGIFPYITVSCVFYNSVKNITF